MRVALYGRNISTKSFKKFFQNFRDELTQRDISYVAIKSYGDFLKNTYKIDCEVVEELSSNFDCLISLGGDGTMLDTLSIVKESGIPVMGINLGRLGFLANIKIEEVQEALDSLIQKNYVIEKRQLLQIESNNDEINRFPFALNDFVVQKRDTSAMITVQSELDDTFLNNYWADGLIVATPTGSSGYSLSCGGPLVFPGSGAFVITPIAAHNLTVRPAVIPDTKKLKLTLESRRKHVLVTLDSRSFKVASNTEITIKKAPFAFNMIQVNGKNYMDTIRNKLLWGADNRNQ